MTPLIHYSVTSKPYGVTRRETMPYAVTPHTHGVTTAYAENISKAIQPLGYTYGVKHGVKPNQSHTPVTAIHSMA